MRIPSIHALPLSYSSMSRLANLLFNLLRKLLPSAFVKGSTKLLLLLIRFIRQRFKLWTKGVCPSYRTPSRSTILPSQSENFPVNDVVGPSSHPPMEPASQTSSHVQYVCDEHTHLFPQHRLGATFHPSLPPRSGDPLALPNIPSLPQEVQDDNIGISGHHSAGRLPSASAMCLSLHDQSISTSAPVSRHSLDFTLHSSQQWSNFPTFQLPTGVSALLLHRYHTIWCFPLNSLLCLHFLVQHNSKAGTHVSCKY